MRRRRRDRCVRQINKHATTMMAMTTMTRIIWLTDVYCSLNAQARVTRIKEKRAAKEEKERYAKLAEKMNKKRVERLKRKEKRNKLLNS